MPLCRILATNFLVSAITITSFTFLYFADSDATLCASSGNETESPYLYLVSFIDSLGYAQEAITKVQRNQNTTSDDTFFDLMYGLKLAKSDFECAAALVSPYTSSANEAIRMSASSAELSFIQLAELQAQTVADVVLP